MDSSFFFKKISLEKSGGSILQIFLLFIINIILIIIVGYISEVLFSFDQKKKCK